MGSVLGSSSADGHRKIYAFTVRPREGRARANAALSLGKPPAKALPKRVYFSDSSLPVERSLEATSGDQPIKAKARPQLGRARVEYPKNAGDFFSRLGSQFAKNLKSAFLDPFVLIAESCFKESTKAGKTKTSIDPPGVALAAFGAVIVPPVLLFLSPVFLLTCLADAACVGVTGRTIPGYLNYLDRSKRRVQHDKSVI